MCANSMEDYCGAANTIDEDQVRAQLALGEASQIEGALAKAVLPKRVRRPCPGNQDIEDVSRCFRAIR